MSLKHAWAPQWRRCAVAAAALAVFGGPAQAFQFDAPEGWSIRWDNSVRASTKYRLQSADPALSQSFVGGNPANGPQALNFNAGDQNFQKRGIFSERLDLLSEFDAVWQRDFGLRLSAAGWYDHKIRGTTQATDSANAQTPYNEFSQETKRRAGRKAELLDAFVFGGWRLGGDAKLTARLGRHGLQYGESLFFGDNGIARAQGPIDIDKLLAAPGAQFKEIIRPVPQLSTQLQLGSSLSVGGYYQFRWEEDRLPAPGTYFSTSNNGWGTSLNESVGLPPNPQLPAGANFLLSPGGDIKPQNTGQYGLQLKYRLDDTDLGFYYARYHDKAGQISGRLNFASLAVIPALGPTPVGAGQWYFRFPEGIRTWGMSASRSVGDFNLAGEASIRQNMPLRSTNMLYGFPTGPTSVTPEPQFATAKTAHVNFSWLATLEPNLLAQETSFLGELAWHRVLSLNDPSAELDKSRTRDATAIRMILSPSYRQALPGLDVSVPVGLGYTLQGQSAISAGWASKNSGDLSIGIEGNYLGVWQAGLNYTHYIGKAIPFVNYATAATLGAPTFSTGQPLADRDFISLSVRRTF